MNLYMRLIVVSMLLLGTTACSLLYRNPPLPNEQSIQAAVESWQYAQMAANTYKPHRTFKLPPTIKHVRHVDNDNIGFAYSVFERVSDGTVTEVILSFRGTDNFMDWPLGNIAPLQNRAGYRVYHSLREETPDETPITVIGHSLGGAIAQHVSLRKPNANAFVFNTSTRFYRGSDPQSNEILMLSEYGDANAPLRWFSIAPKSRSNIVSCTIGDPFTNHAMATLAACLTIFAQEKSLEARNSRFNNLILLDEFGMRDQSD